ncbi:MAG: FtsX-like permease family protein [Gemmatimonadetes bacterium]|jgi:putative ABC transport system permease protein|nr:FtsX-like permease family protein [Gemmatimonadota bacterium]MBT6145859.1 FtsX-like permease family protein [Gemmatimonadota bacterium]MBT7861402.1 FtsX-like permease family protein [Gemmatimonadota bacterium]
MIFYECIGIALTQLFANKVRSLLTLLGMLIGVGSVVGIVSISEGLRRMVYEEFGKLGGANFAYIVPQEWVQKDGRWVRAPRFEPLKMADIDLVRDVSDRVEAVLPILGAGADIRYGKASYQGQVEGTTPAYATAYDWKLEEGRFLLDDDLKNRRSVAVIGQRIVEEVFGRRPPVGEEIKIRGQRHLVVGVMSPRKIFNDDWGNRVMVPVTTAQQRLLGTKNIGGLLIYTKHADDAPIVLPQIEAALKKRHGAEMEYQIESGKSILDQVEQTIMVMKLVTGGVAGISLLVGGIGIMNIMLVSVTERTREIGIRKALGARPATLLTQFVVEAIVLSMIGGALGVGFGIGIGVGISAAIEHFAETPFPSVVSAASVFLALGISTGVGLFFGIYPAARAARLDPVEALSHE